MAEDKAFEIPDNLLNSLAECSHGGFVLFTFDDNKNPQVYVDFDDELNALALQKHVRNWIECIETVNKQLLVQKVIDEIKAASRRKKD